MNDHKICVFLQCQAIRSPPPKMAMTNNVVGGINFIAVPLSIPILASGIWLSTQPDNACVKLIQWPVISLGVVMLVVALAGFVGAFWRLPWLLFFYLVAMMLLILLLISLVAFIYVVTATGSGHMAPGRMFMEYNLNDYSAWMKQRVRSSYKWERIQHCLSSTSVCAHLNRTYTSPQQFFIAPISPLQSGCCKPPTKCGYTYVSPTYWISPINPAADADCSQWSNDPARLCYGCDSCKAGLLANLKREWRRADLILLVSLLLLIFVYLTGCFAFRTAKTEDLFRKYKQGQGYYNN